MTRLLGVIVMCSALLAPRYAAADEAAVPITTVAVSDGISMLVGRGGNIAVSNGVDGMLVIDDQYASQAVAIKNALAELSDAELKFVLNTHWHSDHAGSNAALAASGAVIIAHDNVRKRLATDQVIEFFKSPRPASPPAALPVVTFAADLTFHFNGDTIRVLHVPNAHTDGDAVVHFTTANVIHTGDVFFNGVYPFIDAGSGGSIRGMIAAVDVILALSDAETRIIPGHGPLSNRKQLQRYRDMLQAAEHAVANEMIAGHSVEEAIANQPLAEFDGEWGNGFINPETFVRMVWNAMTRATLE